jgi:hypothetical protein
MGLLTPTSTDTASGLDLLSHFQLTKGCGQLTAAFCLSLPFNPGAVDTTPVLGKTNLPYKTKFVNLLQLAP